MILHCFIERKTTKNVKIMKQSEVEKDVKQRVLQVLDECKISVNKLASSFEANTRTLNDQINGGSKIGAATLVALADFRPDLSAEWLLRGTGSMLLNTETTWSRDGVETESSADVAELKDQLRRKDREIDGLYERIKELKGDIATPHRSVATA